MDSVDMGVAIQQAILCLGSAAKKDGSSGTMKFDSWSNLASGIGKDKDKSEYNRYEISRVLDATTIEALYRGDGIAKTIIKAPAKDSMKNWITLTNDDNSKVMKQLTKLKAKQAFTQLIIHQRKFGGGVILIQTKMGGDLSKPIQFNNQTEIIGLKNYSREDFEINEFDIIEDEKSIYFEDIEVFNLKKRRTGLTIKVHRSRLIILKGERLDIVDGIPDDVQDYYWGASVMTPIIDALSHYSIGMKAVSTMLQEATITKFKMAGLADLLAQMGSEDGDASKEAWKKFNARVKAMVVTKSVIESILLDAESDEDMMRESYNFTGVPEVISLNQMQVSGMSEIPITKLFGRSPSGQNATGESDQENYNNLNIGIQEDVEPEVQRIVNLITGTEDAHIVEFNHPKKPTEKELLEMKKIQSDIDVAMIGATVYTPEVVELNRFTGEYSFETQVGESEIDRSGNTEEEEIADSLTDYVHSMSEEKVDKVIEELEKTDFNNISKEDRIAALMAHGFSEARIKRMTNS